MDIVGSNEGLSSRTEVFSKTGAPKNFQKPVCQSLLFNKVTGLHPATWLRRDSGTGVFL